MNWWIERHTTHDLHLLKNEFNKDSVSYQKKKKNRDSESNTV